MPTNFYSIIRKPDADTLVASAGSNTLAATWFSEIKPEKQKWLWRGKIPLGALTLLIGDMNVGKSVLTTDWAARITSGTPWPDGKPIRLGEAVFLAPEDSAGSTMVPRFLAAGGDQNLACSLASMRGDGGMATSTFSLKSELGALEQFLQRHTQTRLLIIDPLNAYLGGVNTGLDANVRSVLTPLTDLAARRGIAVVAIVHLNKSQGKKAMYRSLGSIGIQGVARAVWLVTPDPERGKDAKLLLPVKFNIGRKPLGIAYRVVSATTNRAVAAIKYERFDVTVDADDMVNAPRPRPPSATTSAVEWIRKVMGNRTTISSAEMRDLVAKEGISWRTFERARQEVGLFSRKIGKIWHYTSRTRDHPKGSGPDR